MVMTSDQGTLSVNGQPVARLQKVTISQDLSAVHEPNGLGYAYPYSVQDDAFKAAVLEIEVMLIDIAWASLLHSGTTLGSCVLTITKENGDVLSAHLSEALVTAQKVSGNVNEIIMETVTIQATQLDWQTGT